MKVGFIGAGGNIAGAIINGIISEGYIKPSDINICDVLTDKLEPFIKLGANLYYNNLDIALNSEFIFLCVKPQNIFDVINDIADVITSEKRIVSIAAGISIQSIKAAVGSDCKVIRVMPNTPLLLSHGASALVKQSPVTETEFDFVCDIFNALGIVEVCEEEQINAVTAVSGSGPAYVFKFAKAVIDEAEALGLNRQTAENLFVETLIGSAVMMRDSSHSIEDLIKMVTSPKGTTLAALESFDSNHFDTVIKEGVRACKNRADELGKLV